MNTKFESFSVYFKIEEKPISKNFKMDNGLVVFFPKNVFFFFLMFHTWMEHSVSS